MPFQRVPNGALTVVEGTLDGEKVVNTLGWGLRNPGTVNAAQLQSLCESVAIRWESQMIPQLPAQYIMGVVRGRVLDVEDGPVAESGIHQGQAGSLAGNLLPNSVSITIAFKTGLGGRTNRGRNYWCGLLEADVTGSLVSSTRANAIVAAYETMLVPGNVDSSFTWCVISRKIIDLAAEGRAIPITSVVVNDLVVDSQRRRLPGRGA